MLRENSEYSVDFVLAFLVQRLKESLELFYGLFIVHVSIVDVTVHIHHLSLLSQKRNERFKEMSLESILV